MRRVTIAALVIGLLGSACAAVPTEMVLGPPAACDITWTPPAPSSRGRLLLIAQSVPEATMIPCLGPLPPGWAFTRATVESSRSTIVLETDTYDLVVTVELVERCREDASEALLETEIPDTTLHVTDAASTFVYRFAGGCVRIEYPTRQLAESGEGRALFDEIHLMSRDELRELSGWEL